MNNEPKPSIWKAWIVVSVLIAPIAWGFALSTHVPKIVVIVIALLASLAAARALNDRVRQKYRTLVFLALAAATIGIAHADVTTGGIAGYVSVSKMPNDPPTGPAQNALVFLRGVNMSAEARTDANGFYSFISVPPGCTRSTRRCRLLR